MDIENESAVESLPEYYEPWQTVYKRFAQWQENGKLKALFDQLREGADMQDLCIDGTYIKAHRASAGAKKGTWTTPKTSLLVLVVEDDPPKSMIHAVVDGLGNPCVFMLTGGQVHDSIMMKPVLDQLDISQSVILADKAYGSAENRKYISDRGAQYCIPPKEGLSKPWKCDYFHYKERHLVECFFMKIKDYRRVSMRFEKLARRFLGMVYLASCLIWLA